MDDVYTCPTPYISRNSQFPQPILTVKELQANKHRIQTQGDWKKGKLGHYSLALTLYDGASRRKPRVQLFGESPYGLDVFKGGDNTNVTEEPPAYSKENSDSHWEPSERKKRKNSSDDDEQTEKKRKKKKEKKKSYIKPLTLALLAEESKDSNIAAFAQVVDPLITSLIKPKLPELVKQLKLDSENTPFYRRVARASSGSTEKMVRVTCYAGGTQLSITDEGNKVSMKNFPKGIAGPYGVVAELHHIDASAEKGLLTWGLVMYGKIINLEMNPEMSIPLKMRKKETEEIDFPLNPDGDSEATAEWLEKRAKKRKIKEEEEEEEDKIKKSKK